MNATNSFDQISLVLSIRGRICDFFALEGISSSVLSVFFTDKFALSQSDARISVAYNSWQWKTLTKRLMKCPPRALSLHSLDHCTRMRKTNRSAQCVMGWLYLIQCEKQIVSKMWKAESTDCNLKITRTKSQTMMISNKISTNCIKKKRERRAGGRKREKKDSRSASEAFFVERFTHRTYILQKWYTLYS